MQCKNDIYTSSYSPANASVPLRLGPRYSPASTLSSSQSAACSHIFLNDEPSRSKRFLGESYSATFPASRTSTLS